MVQVLPFGAYVGTQVGAPVVLAVAPIDRRARVQIDRDTWNIPGKTLTVKKYKKVGGNFVLWDTGIAESGPSTIKGVANPNPAMPDIGIREDGEFRIDVETSETIGYMAEVV